MPYSVKIEQFEGPLDLLLQLIEQEKLDVTRVSLSHVADQYLEFIGNRESISLENLSQFLSIASKLILIKSKALLPLLRFTEEEEEEIRDLEHQLALYKKFREIAVKLGELADLERHCFSREGYVGHRVVFCPPEEININDLRKSFQRILGQIPILEKLEEEVIREVLTLEEKIFHLQDTLKKKIESSFSEIISSSKDKIEVVVSFLALLELVKQKIIHVEQSHLFEEIRMKHIDTKSQQSVTNK